MPPGPALPKNTLTRSLPALFRTHGYQTLALGKITHYPGNLTGRQWAEGPEELPGVWDRAWIPNNPWKAPEAIMHGYANGVARVPGRIRMRPGITPKLIRRWSKP